jgi:muconolactone delta-isomerase
MCYPNNTTDELRISMKEFMASISLPGVISEEYIELLPAQKEYISKLVNQKKITSYGLSTERTKLWITFAAESEHEVWLLLAGFSLYKYMEVVIDEMLLHENTKLFFPKLCYN